MKFMSTFLVLGFFLAFGLVTEELDCDLGLIFASSGSYGGYGFKARFRLGLSLVELPLLSTGFEST